MVNPATLAILGGISISGAILGVYLGHSAVGEIDPTYFGTEEATTFHADLVPYRSDDRSDVRLATVQGEVPIFSCKGCRAYPEEYRPIADPAVERVWDQPTATAEYAEAPSPIEEAGQAAADPEREAVVRYASYPVFGVEEAPAGAQPETLEPTAE